MKLFFDTETHLITPGCLIPKLVSLASAPGNMAPNICNHNTAYNAWVDMLARPAAIFIGHYLAFDMAVMAAHTNTLRQVLEIYDSGRVRCTKIRQRLLDIAAGRAYAKASLAACTKQHLGIVMDGKTAPKGSLDSALQGDWTALHTMPPRYRYAQLDGVPLADWPQAWVDYALADVTLTRDVYHAQGADTLTNEVEQCRADFALILMGAWGVRTDPERVAALREALTHQHVALEEILIDHGIIKCTTVTRGKNKGAVRKVKQTGPIRGLVLGALGEAAPTTAKGAVSTSKATVKAAAIAALAAGDDATHAALTAVADISGPQKLLTTYIPLLTKGTTGPLCASYNVIVATGRTSCRRPNMQNQPRAGGVRDCYRPRAGKVWVGADYSAIEMVSLAQILLNLNLGSVMADTLNAGTDPHILFASQVVGIPYEEALARYLASDPEMVRLRQGSKIANYGFPGGMGPNTLVEYALGFGVVMTIDFAKQLKRGFLATWPGMRGYFKHIAQLVGDNTGVVTQFVSERVRGGVSYCEAANTLFQGLTADGVKAALWQVTWACLTQAGPLAGWHPVVFVHDEIILEGPADGAAAALAALQQHMIAGMQPYMPNMVIRTEGKIMADRWVK